VLLRNWTISKLVAFTECVCVWFCCRGYRLVNFAASQLFVCSSNPHVSNEMGNLPHWTTMKTGCLVCGLLLSYMCLLKMSFNPIEPL